MDFIERLEVENNIITKHVIGKKPETEKDGVIYIYGSNFQANIGEDIRIYEDIFSGKKKTLKKLVEENLIKIPEGKKLNSDGTDFEDMSEAEKVLAGITKLKSDEKIENGYIIKKSINEQYKEGLISKEEYNSYIYKQREIAYKQESDPLGMQVLRGELDRAEWLSKIEEIKKRYPKVD